MIGRARTFGAITITYALPSGIGCAAGIALSVDAEVSLVPRDPPARVEHQIPPSSRTPLVEEAIRQALTRFGSGSPVEAHLSLRSEIPPGRGLKSSSAVATAVVLATARAAGRAPTLLKVARVAADAGRAAGVSATGALDDALAGLEPGFVVTDNRRDELLRRTDIDPDWGVVLYVPAQAHPPAPDLLSRFAVHRKQGELSARAAMDGDWVRAMRLNTELVERAMGYSYEKVRDRLASRGAIASGVCGLGPALAAIGPTERLSDLVAEFPPDDSERRIVAFSRPDPSGGEVL